MVLKAVIVDDERPGIDNLISITRDYIEDIQICDTAMSIEGAVEIIRKHKPDLVFLDIELGAGTGFELLDHFGHEDFEIIFITAYDYYAVKAFRTKAADYILKPIDIDELKEAIHKVRYNISLKRIKKEHDKPAGASGKNHMQYLKINTSDGIEMIKLDDIVLIQAINYYSNIILKSKKEIICTKYLKEFEIQLKTFNFFRTHNSYIINLDHIKSIDLKDSNTITMINGEKVKVSRRRKEDFIAILGPI